MAVRTRNEFEGLGANEQAILDRIPWMPLRRLVARLVRMKMRLQFTGWLQYLVPLPAILLLALLGGVLALIGLRWPATVLLAAAGLLVAVVALDVVTTKLRIRLPETRPPRLDDLDQFDLLRARRSCRSFQTRTMSDHDRDELMASIETHLAVPTLGSNVPRFEYVEAPLTVWPTVNASEFLVAVVPKTYDRSAVIDVGRTLQRIVMDATRMGLATCWIGPGADHDSVTAHLGNRFDPEADQIICVCAVGYRSRYIPLFIRIFNRQVSGRRRPVSGLFFSDRGLEKPIDVTATPYDQFGRIYEACQWAPSSYNGQTTRAVVEADERAVSAVHFLATTESRYYAPVALGIWCAHWELGCDALGMPGEFELVAPGDGDLPRRDITWRPLSDGR